MKWVLFATLLGWLSLAFYHVIFQSWDYMGRFFIISAVGAFVGHLQNKIFND